MVIGERYERILEAACDVIAHRRANRASAREIARAAGLT
jgi:AcrR family transcriptional regulator